MKQTLAMLAAVLCLLSACQPTPAAEPVPYQGHDPVDNAPSAAAFEAIDAPPRVETSFTDEATGLTVIFDCEVKTPEVSGYSILAAKAAQLSAGDFAAAIEALCPGKPLLQAPVRTQVEWGAYIIRCKQNLGESDPGYIQYLTEQMMNAPQAYLAGATFILSASETLAGTPTAPDYEDANAIKLVGSDNTYRVAKADEAGAKTYFTTNGTGNITINGLEADTYYLHEVAAPDGYNKLADPVKVEIQVTGQDGADSAPSYDVPVYVISIGEEAGTSSTNNVVGIENKSGTMLPETGGIGTIGLTVAGVAVVLLGIFLPRRKKKNGKSNGSKA